MAYEIPGQLITYKASTGVLSTTSASMQYRFVAINEAGQAVLPTTGAAVDGILQNKPRVENDSATIMINGVSKVVAAGSVLSAGDWCGTDASGRAAPVGAGDYTIGRVLGGSSGSTGRVLTVQLQSVGTT